MQHAWPTMTWTAHAVATAPVSSVRPPTLLFCRALAATLWYQLLMSHAAGSIKCIIVGRNFRWYGDITGTAAPKDDSEQCAVYCVDTPGCMVAAYDGTTCYPKRLKNIDRAWFQAGVIVPTGSLFACTPSNACIFSVPAHALPCAPLCVKHENILGPRPHSVCGFLIRDPFCRPRPTTLCGSMQHCDKLPINVIVQHEVQQLWWPLRRQLCHFCCATSSFSIACLPWLCCCFSASAAPTSLLALIRAAVKLLENDCRRVRHRPWVWSRQRHVRRCLYLSASCALVSLFTI